MKQTYLSGQPRDFWLAMMIVLALVLAPLGLAPRTASAANTNYYVNSVSGSDGNSGTSSGSPWKSLGPVNGRTFGAGDVINLARGSSWTGGGGNTAALTLNGSGVSGSPIRVQPYGTGAAPIIRNPSSGYSQGVLVRGAWVVVQGLLVREARESGIRLPAGADHVVVQNNEVTASGAGIMVQSQYNLITRNYLHDLTMVVNTSGGDDDYGASAVLVKGPNNEVSYNRIVNCKASSYDYGSDGSAVEFYNNVDNSSIHHNISINALSFNEIGGGSARNVKIAYNVIVGSSPVEVIHASDQFASAISNLQFTNNTVVNTGSVNKVFWIGGSLPGVLGPGGAQQHHLRRLWDRHGQQLGVHPRPQPVQPDQRRPAELQPGQRRAPGQPAVRQPGRGRLSAASLQPGHQRRGGCAVQQRLRRLCRAEWRRTGDRRLRVRRHHPAPTRPYADSAARTYTHSAAVNWDVAEWLI